MFYFSFYRRAIRDGNSLDHPISERTQLLLTLLSFLDNRVAMLRYLGTWRCAIWVPVVACATLSDVKQFLLPPGEPCCAMREEQFSLTAPSYRARATAVTGLD